MLTRCLKDAVLLDALLVLGQPTTPAESADCPLDELRLGQHDEVHDIGPLECCDIDLGADATQLRLLLT